MGLARDGSAGGAECREAPSAVAASIRHVQVQSKIVPTGSERGPRIEPPYPQDGAHAPAGAKRKALALDVVGDTGEQGVMSWSATMSKGSGEIIGRISAKSASRGTPPIAFGLA
jgi:hypothetical protein